MTFIKKPKFFSPMWLVLLTAVITGCGMKVASTNPVNGGTGVASNALITATFNIDAKPETVNAGTFLVKDSLGNPVLGTVSYRKKVATFTPQSGLAPSTDFIVTLKADVTNIFDQPMASDYLFAFTTRNWGTAGAIETGNIGQALYPQVAIDPGGNAIAVWQQSDGTRYNILANRYTPASGWGEAELIETDNSGWAEHPQVAVDPNGNATAVWSQSDGTLYNIWANRYTPVSGWGTAGLIETENSGDASEPQVAIDANGNAIALWHQWDGIRYNIWANRYTPAGGWDTARLIETDDAGHAKNPQVAMDPDGNAIAVWYQSDGTLNNIWFNRYTPAGGWGTAGLIETSNAGSAWDPQVAVDHNGNAVVVWYQSAGTRYNIWANRYSPASGWETARLIETKNTGDAMYPQIAIDEDGNAVVVWMQSDGTRNNIWANRYTPTDGWAVAGLIETDNTGEAYEPQVAVDPGGKATAVWAQYDGTLYSIRASRYIPGVGWGMPQLIETENAGDAAWPQVAMAPDGYAMVVWWQFDGTWWNIWANRFE